MYLDESVMLDARCGIRELATSFLSELDRLKTKYGDVGYRKAWVLYHFPESARQELAQVVKSWGSQ